MIKNENSTSTFVHHKSSSPFNFDSFSHGQIKSKLWLCSQLEPIIQSKFQRPVHIAIYGSWYGLLPLMILLRGRIQIASFSLYDIDQEALDTSKKILNFWSIESSSFIRFFNFDVNLIDSPPTETDVLINCSCEHISSIDWFSKIPEHILFAVQSTNMIHPTHIAPAHSISDFKKQLKLNGHVLVEAKLETHYPNYSFERYLLIGQKNASEGDAESLTGKPRGLFRKIINLIQLKNP